jgi:hypothetical protein
MTGKLRTLPETARKGKGEGRGKRTSFSGLVVAVAIIARDLRKGLPVRVNIAA